MAVSAFVAKILDPVSGSRFLKTFVPLATQLARLGMVNSLTQVVLKMTVPGVPDFYQGNELWDFSLVDPDNRRPVDYEKRKTMLAALDVRPSAPELLESWTDGRIKLFVTRELLHFRRAHPELFKGGTYVPVSVTGDFPASVVAFTREANGQRLLVCVPRLSSRVGFPPVGNRWKKTALELGGRWRNLFTGEEVAGERLCWPKCCGSFRWLYWSRTHSGPDPWLAAGRTSLCNSRKARRSWSKSTGLTRCIRKPASWERRRSSSMP